MYDLEGERGALKTKRISINKNMINLTTLILEVLLIKKQFRIKKDTPRLGKDISHKYN